MQGYNRRTTWFRFFHAYKLHKAIEEQQKQHITLKKYLKDWARRQNIRRYITKSIKETDIAILDTIKF